MCSSPATTISISLESIIFYLKPATAVEHVAKIKNKNKIKKLLRVPYINIGKKGVYTSEMGRKRENTFIACSWLTSSRKRAKMVSAPAIVPKISGDLLISMS